MKKMEVKGIYPDIHLTGILSKESVIGKDRPKVHPLSRQGIWIPTKDIKGIKVGDVLRCDGLPFMSRPASIIKTNEDGRVPIIFSITKGRLIHHYTHKPYKLESGYWVLRPTSRS